MKKILIVDDDRNILQLIEARLKDYNHNLDIQQATDGIEAFALMKMGFIPDLALLDVSMPNMDGLTLIQEMKWDQELKDVSIIVLTARAHTKNIFKSLGLVHFMTKPFDSKKLIQKVEHCIN